MDRRTFLALLLSALVIVVTPILFHSFGPRQSPPAVTSRDTTATASAPATPTPAATASQPAAIPAPAVSSPTVPPRPTTDTTSVDAAKVRYVFSTGGGAAPK